ncbi:adenylate/guanylate cyclase domain-containing protein [Bradyrhizobium erythrophlei]|uniref:adenylate/guanylate cyclase domain-containing protein n=1 Tax=Bradyrhizobium erythrophlei TaxID=1437360 RepID=UPI0035ED0701
MEQRGPESRVERRLAAVLAADVVGYSRLMGRDEERTLAELKSLRQRLIDPTVATHRGRIVKTTGDGMLVEFASAVDAARCAVELQRGMAAYNAELPQEARIDFRIGIHVGDVMVDDNDIFGDGVNIAARLEGLAEPGGVCLSEDAHRQIRGKVDTAFEDMGPQVLKNITEPMRAWRARLGNAPRSTTPVTSAAETSQPLQLPDKPSIAVLPFQNMSGDPEQEYFVDGLVEDIITALSRFKSLFVIARNSTFTYKGRAVDIKQVGRELGVRYVLEGSVRKAGNRVRISGQLIKADTGTHIWADRYDGELAEIFELQDQVTHDVVGAIAPRLEQAEIERARRKPTGSLDAYDHYLRGLACSYRMDRESIAEAMEFVGKAIELDPGFATAYGLGAWCYYWRRVNRWTTEHEREIGDAARLAASAAAFGQDDAIALSYAGMALGHVAGEAEAGLALADRARLLNTNLAIAWHASGSVCVPRGPLDQASERLSHALRLSPLDPLSFCTLSYAALANFLAGQADAAWPLAERACRDQPHFLLALRVAAASNAAAGRLAEARAFAARALQLDPDLSLSNLSSRIGPLLPERFAKYAEALRQAGVPD